MRFRTLAALTFLSILLAAPLDAASVVYYLPFAPGKEYGVFQGNDQGPSHNNAFNRYAYDFSMVVGTPIHAAAGGKVTKVKEDTAGPTGNYDDNNMIWIRHADGTTGVYVHIKQNGSLVEVGDTVARGDLIGYSGNTGMSDGPHLHFSLLKGGRSVPCQFTDFPGGVPKTNDRARSQNVPVRLGKELLTIAGRFDRASRLGCLEVVAGDIEDAFDERTKKSLEKQRTSEENRAFLVEYYQGLKDQVQGGFEEQARQRLEAIREARTADDYLRALELAWFGARDFEGSKVEDSIEEELEQLQEDERYRTARQAFRKKEAYRKRLARALKYQSDLELKAMLGARIPWERVARKFEACLEAAPDDATRRALQQHIEALKQR